MKSALLSLFALALIATTAPLTAHAASTPKAAKLTAEELAGVQALQELGLKPSLTNRRLLREAGLLKKYQAAWNDFEPEVTDFSKITNPKKIVDAYTDETPLLYRDMCMPHGLTKKSDFMTYLAVLYQAYPRQVWGNGWKNIHLFVGTKPGEWAYYYEFEMYKSIDAGATPAITGTGMERVQFDESGKLISDEVHLILKSGRATCIPAGA